MGCCQLGQAGASAKRVGSWSLPVAAHGVAGQASCSASGNVQRRTPAASTAWRTSGSQSAASSARRSMPYPRSASSAAAGWQHSSVAPGGSAAISAGQRGRRDRLRQRRAALAPGRRRRRSSAPVRDGAAVAAARARARRGSSAPAPRDARAGGSPDASARGRQSARNASSWRSSSAATADRVGACRRPRTRRAIRRPRTPTRRGRRGARVRARVLCGGAPRRPRAAARAHHQARRRDDPLWRARAGSPR